MLQSVHNSLEQLHLMQEQISLNRFFNTLVIQLVSESVNATTAASAQDLLRYYETFFQKY